MLYPLGRTYSVTSWEYMRNLWHYNNVDHNPNLMRPQNGCLFLT